MKKHISKALCKAKNIIKQEASMVFCNVKQHLYLKTDVQGVQVRKRKWYPRNEVPDNSALWPIVFTNKSLTSAETHYNNIEREVLSTLHGLEFQYY